MALERLEILSRLGNQSLIRIPSGSVITSHNHFFLLRLPHIINVHVPSPSGATHRGNLNNSLITPADFLLSGLYNTERAEAIHKRLKWITTSHVEIHILHSLNEIDG